MSLRIAIYGGSFDPLHVGHLAVIAYTMAILDPDELWVMPCWDHAFGKKLAPFKDRYGPTAEAVHNIFADKVRVRPSEQDYQTKYTIDLIESLRADGEEGQYHLVVGEDAYNERHKWHRWDDLISKVFIFPVGRMGVGESTELFPVKASIPRMPEVSSSEIRRLIAAGREGDYAPMLPSSVLRYIREHQLYGYRGQKIMTSGE